MQNSKWLNIFFWLMIAIVIAVDLYLFNPFHYYFLNDDLIHIPLSKAGMLFQRRSFRPLADLSVRLDYLLWGTKAWGYHLTNLLLHVANSFLVYQFSWAVIKKYFKQVDGIYALWSAILFFTYAFHSESIFWILGRSGSLGSLFFLPSVICYLKRHEHWRCFLGCLLFFGLGLLAYESVWIFPFVVFVISWTNVKFAGDKLKFEVKFLLPVFGLFLVYLIIRYLVIGEIAGGYEAESFKAFEIIRLFVNFLKLIDRSFLPPAIHTTTQFLLAALLLSALVFVAVTVIKSGAEAKEKKLLLVIALLFLLSLFPYLSLGIDTHGVEGERYLYLPSVFVSMLVVFVLTFTSQKKQRLAFVAVLGFHLFFLGRSAGNYITASAVSKTTFSALNSLKSKKRLFIDSLPQGYKGALIFRLGFDEGFAWLAKPGSVDSIIVLSLKKNNTLWTKNYPVQYMNKMPFRSISSILIRDSLQATTYVSQKVSSYVFNPLTDVWFVFKDDHLEVYK